MEKVFVLTIDTEEGHETRAFSTKKKAQDIMRERYKAEKHDYVSTYGEDNISYSIGNDCAYVQLAGRYVEEHIDFKITECEIE